MKIGNLDISAFKVGDSDCSIYLGDVKLYPQKESYPYVFQRISRGGSAYTVNCSATSADTITSAQTKSGLTNAQISGTTATQTPVEVTFGDCCQRINSGVCSGWTQLTSITISDSVTALQNPSNNRAFYNCCRVEKLNIGSGITSINGILMYQVGSSANTKPDLDLSMNNGLTLSNTVFHYCNFNKVKLPKNLSLSGTVFERSKINSLSFGNNTVISSGMPFNFTEISVVNLNNVVSIGNGAFNSSYGYTDIDIPSSVEYIGNNVFYNSGNTSTLTSVTLNYTSRTTVGNGVFKDSKAIQNVSVGNSVAEIGEGMFSGCTNLNNITIGNGLTTIGVGAFSGCTSLPNITIPHNVTSIGESAFRNCTSLSSVNIPSGVTTINESTFNGCSGLTSVTIPNSVTYLGVGAFVYCSKLTSIEVPSGVTYIGASAFQNCSGLTSITINATTPPTLGNTNALTSTNNCPIYVPSGSVNAYKAATNWSTYASRIQAKT